MFHHDLYYIICLTIKFVFVNVKLFNNNKCFCIIICNLFYLTLSVMKRTIEIYENNIIYPLRDKL